MGFNLEVFFAELEGILALDANNDIVLDLLIYSIKENKNYAIACGLIK